MLNDNRILDFYINSFENNKYDNVKEFLETYKKKVINRLEKYKHTVSEEDIQNAIDNILCLNNYSVIKWAAQNSDTEALSLVKNYLSSHSLYNAIIHNNHEAFDLFITGSKSDILLGLFNHEVFKEGLEFFKHFYSKSSIDINEFFKVIDNNLDNHKELSNYIQDDLFSFKSNLTGVLEDDTSDIG